MQEVIAGPQMRVRLVPQWRMPSTTLRSAGDVSRRTAGPRCRRARDRWKCVCGRRSLDGFDEIGVSRGAVARVDVRNECRSPGLVDEAVVPRDRNEPRPRTESDERTLTRRLCAKGTVTRICPRCVYRAARRFLKGTPRGPRALCDAYRPKRLPEQAAPGGAFQRYSSPRGAPTIPRWRQMLAPAREPIGRGVPESAWECRRQNQELRLGGTRPTHRGPPAGKLDAMVSRVRRAWHGQ